MMAKQICTFSYIIAIILILSNVRNVSTLSNDEHATPQHHHHHHQHQVASSSAVASPSSPSSSSLPSTAATLHHVADATNDATPIASAQSARTTSDSADPLSAIRAMRFAHQPSTNAFQDNGADFMQRTLHNQQRSTTMSKQMDRQYLVQRDAMNAQQQQHHDEQSHQQLLSSRRFPHESHNTNNGAAQFMNEAMGKHAKHSTNQPNDSNGAAATVDDTDDDTSAVLEHASDDADDDAADVKTAQLTRHNRTTEHSNRAISPNDDDAPSSSGGGGGSSGSFNDDETISMPMKHGARDIGNGASVDTPFERRSKVDGEIEPIRRQHTAKPSRFDDSQFSDSDRAANERSRYLETDLDFDGELPETDDKMAWTDDESDGIAPLKLPSNDGADDADEADDDQDGDHDEEAAEHRWSIEEPVTQRLETTRSHSTQNIYKVAKPNKSRALKHVTPNDASLAPQALRDLAANKTTPGSGDGINFHYITDLYDQYEWNVDDFRRSVNRKCAGDMQRYLDALLKGELWATRANDASGRYRGQFLFDNNYWLGSMVVCNAFKRADDIQLNFFIATTHIHGPDPLIKRHFLQVGQCLPRHCTPDDIKAILNVDAAALKFNANYANVTSNTNKGAITVLSVRRVPGDYNIWRDGLFYLVSSICITFCTLVVWASLYEQSLFNQQAYDNELAAQPIHSVAAIAEKPDANPNHIYTYENGSSDIDACAEPRQQRPNIDKVHKSNNTNGCTLELLPISPENNNGNLGNNNRNIYRLNNNNKANNGNNNHNGNNCTPLRPADEAIAADNKMMQTGAVATAAAAAAAAVTTTPTTGPTQRNGSTAYVAKAIDSHITDGLSVPRRLLLCFSVPANAKTILSTKKLPQDSIGCIHGVRVFSMFWTILVHTYLQIFAISENRFSKTITETTFLFQVVGNATFTVDTFFFISGLLVTLLFLRTQKPSKAKRDVDFVAGTKQTFMLIIYRYIRLTPVYFMVIVINAVTLKYVYNGAVFTPGLPDHITCPEYWWHNILYIQTLFPPQQLCMLWSWYLADDMQFYVWAIALLIIAKRHPKAAVTVITTFLCTSWIVSALISLKYNYTHKVADPLESFGYLYEKPWTRLGPYVMGMVAGYLLTRYKTAPIKITPAVNAVLWVLSLGTMFLLVFGVWHGTLGLLWTAMYVSVGHTAWGLALIWIVLSCKWGLAKPVDKLLSYPSLLPLSRLTYCAYLVHPVSQIVMSFDLKGTVHIQHSLVLTIFIGNVMTSYALALLLAVLFEVPFVRMLKILFGKF